jgi:short-subunit dehydrogenase
MTRALRARTVVLTGASSGIGRAAALAFSEAGAHLVLAARRAETLEQVAELCRERGAQVLVVPTDVTQVEQVRALAAAAVERFNAIDVWVNNVGVGAVGAFTETPVEAHRRVVETNLLGHMHGAHVVLRHFMARQRGVLINMISLGAWAAAPYASAYSASKFGLRGFSEALRGELAGWPGIHVCDVYPAFMDTPGVSHAANYTGRRLRPAPPLYDPRQAAEAIVSLARHPRPSVTVGGAATVLRLGHFVSPALSGWLGAKLVERYLGRAEPAPRTDGNLYQASQGCAIDGGFRPRGQGAPSWWTLALAGGALWLGWQAARRSR